MPPRTTHSACVHTHDGRFFGIFMRFSLFLLTFFFFLFRSYSVYPFLRSFVCVCVSYAIKPTGPIKTQLHYFFSFPIFPHSLRSVICYRFLLIFRIRKTVFLVLVAVVRSGVVFMSFAVYLCVCKREEGLPPKRLIYCYGLDLLPHFNRTFLMGIFIYRSNSS